MVKKLRIAHVTATFPPYQAGTGIVAFQNAVELSRRGHEVHVYTSAVPGAPDGEVVQGVGIHRLRPFVQFGNAPLLPALPGALTGFDLIHLHYPFIFGAELTRLATWRSRTPLVASFHNDLVGTGARKLLFAAYQSASAFFTVRGVAKLCVVSRDHYDSTSLAMSLGEHAPMVVELPNGVDTVTFSPGDGSAVRARYNIPTTAPLGLFVAALDRAHHMKGLNRLFEAMASRESTFHGSDSAEEMHDSWVSLDVDGQANAFRLLVVGDGDQRAAYEAQAAAMGLQARVTFAGSVANEAMPGYYRAADVTLLPSSTESFGIVLIESLACGTPVIAGDVAGARTVVDEGVDGFKVPPLDVAAIAASLQRVLRMTTAERRAMGNLGRRKVEARYSWTRIGDQLERIYADLPGL